jgi:DNA-binding transcriptional MerR regulator
MKENLTISRMAELTEVSAYTLRYYERAGLLGPVARNALGRRHYRHDDLEWILMLKALRGTGMPISRIRELVRMASEGNATRHKRIEFYRTYQRELAQQIQARTAAIAIIEKKIQKHQGLLQKENQ